MKVTNNNVNNGLGVSESSRLVSGGKEKAKGPKAEIESSDKVNISSRAREAVKAKHIAKSAPDVDEEKVARLRAAIENGSYRVDADKVADRLVEEHMIR